MNIFVLALKELSCQHCIKNVTQTLQALEKVESVQVTLNFAKIQGEIAPHLAIQAIEQAGYQAELATANFTLVLSGLNCGHCVKSVEKALSAVENLDVFVVSKTQAQLYGNVDPQNAIQAITNAGFEAELENAVPKS